MSAGWGAAISAAIKMVGSNQERQAALGESNRQHELALAAAEEAKFKPYDVSGAFGAAIIDRETGQAGLELTPEMQQLQDLYKQQALGFAGQGQTALGTQASALGTDFLGQIQTDPFAAAESQFSKMEEILNPARQRQREALEGKLLRQGRLGSTGGALQQQSLESAIEESRQKGLYDALSQSQAMQEQQAALGTKFGILGQQQEDIGFQRAQSRLGGLADIDAQALDYMRLGSDLGGRQSTAGATAGRFGMEGAAAQSAAILGAARGQSQSIGQAGTALGSYFSDLNAPDSANTAYDFSDTQEAADTSDWGDWGGV